MSRTTRALLCLAPALLLSIGASVALAQSPSPSANPVLDQVQTLAHLAGAVVAPDAGITATFVADGSLSGFGGCNEYSATWQSDGITLTIGAIAATRKLCDPAVTDLESKYLTLLQDAASWSLNGTAVEIVTSDGSTLVYGGDTISAGVAGAWTLSSVGGTGVPDGIVATAAFGPDGSLTGSGGCNTFSATYTVDGTGLSVSPISATLMHCAASSAFEATYLDALQNATNWSVDGSTLVLDGTSKLIFSDGTSSAGTLTGQTWFLVTRGGTTSDPSLGISAIFAEDGTVSGSGGCNEYNTTWTVDGDGLTIGAIAATRMSCAPRVNESESAFFAAMEGALGFALDGANLVIASADGSTLEFQVDGGPPPSPIASAEPSPVSSPAASTMPSPATSSTPGS